MMLKFWFYYAGCLAVIINIHFSTEEEMMWEGIRASTNSDERSALSGCSTHELSPDNSRLAPPLLNPILFQVGLASARQTPWAAHWTTTLGRWRCRPCAWMTAVPPWKAHPAHAASGVGVASYAPGASKALPFHLCPLCIALGREEVESLTWWLGGGRGGQTLGLLLCTLQTSSFWLRRSENASCKLRNPWGLLKMVHKKTNVTTQSQI